MAGLSDGSSANEQVLHNRSSSVEPMTRRGLREGIGGAVGAYDNSGVHFQAAPDDIFKAKVLGLPSPLTGTSI